MPEYRLEIKTTASPFQIDWADPILMLGSCFAEHIAHRLEQYCFPVVHNPFGIIYNPKSIELLLKRIETQQHFTTEDLINHEGLYFSMQTHSDFAHTDAQTCLTKLNQTLHETAGRIKDSRILVLSLGTAFLYRHLERDELVANCYKIPAKAFKKSMLNQTEVAQSIKAMVESIRALNPGVKVILTLSPVRHWKDGPLKNSLSKSSLRLGIQEAVDTLENTAYFPAFELLIDDLRDYRFYKSDMLHPNDLAIDYIWKKFLLTYFNASSRDLFEAIVKLDKAAKHRPRIKGHPKHVDFLMDHLAQLEILQSKHPKLALTRLKQAFEEQLKA